MQVDVQPDAVFLGDAEHRVELVAGGGRVVESRRVDSADEVDEVAAAVRAATGVAKARFSERFESLGLTCGGALMNLSEAVGCLQSKDKAPRSARFLNTWIGQKSMPPHRDHAE